MHDPASDSAEVLALLGQAKAGEKYAFDRLFALCEGQLRRFVDLRLDPKLRPRVDASDVVQEAHLEAVRRLDDFLENPTLPFKLWLRQITLDRLLMMRRRHVGAARRSLAREAALPDGSSCALAWQLVAAHSTPSQQAGREELARRVREAVARLAEADREIILMRTFESLSFEEIAQLIGVEAAAARKRHGRALLRLHKILTDGGLTESQL
jgi:RNA polymerase sigma-70 factor (ECF subfamily)